jgi:hypothetical protein
LDNVADVNSPKLKNFLLKFKDLLVTIKRINKPVKEGEEKKVK